MAYSWQIFVDKIHIIWECHKNLAKSSSRFGHEGTLYFLIWAYILFGDWGILELGSHLFIFLKIGYFKIVFFLITNLQVASWKRKSVRLKILTNSARWKNESKDVNRKRVDPKWNSWRSNHTNYDQKKRRATILIRHFKKTLYPSTSAWTSISDKIDLWRNI